MITFIKRIVVLLFAATLLSSAQAAPVFPVKYSANKRHLVDQNGTPFPIMGRTAWFVTSLSVADYQTFVDDTAARGYNVIELHVVNHDPRGNHPPFNGNGDRPFLNRLNGTSWNGALTYGNINNEAPDFTTPNAAYWSSVDGLLSYCESKGILVFLFPAYVGYAGGNQGWMQEMVANGSTKMQSYGAWIATRYQNQKNLVWMMGGDMGSFNSAQNSVESALLTGLKSVSGQQSVLFSAEWDSQSIATDQPSFGASMTLNGAYSWTGDVNNQGRRAYARNPVEPAFLLEEPYDEEGSDGNNYNSSATQPVRRFQWWGWLSTIGGYISGNGYVWPFPSTWRNHLNTQGSRDMGRLNAFMGSIAWHNLVPSGLNGMRTLVTAGGSSVSASDYVTASATPDGTLLVAYVPPNHSGSITVDMGAMSGPARARWFDPTSAAYTDIGSGLANSGSRSFTPPGNNSVGAKDWVLVLDNATGSTPASPTISNIPDQTTTVNTATAAIPFTVADSDTPVGNLTLSKASSNSTLVPANNIVFGGSGSSRTVTVTPAANQTGSATITVTVTDGSNSASDTFVLTVNPSSTPPSPGLEGTYFDNSDFTSPKLTRNDSTIDFDWGNGSPDPAIGSDTFSVRWVGQIEPLYSQSYTFYALTDDGFRLWVNNQLIIDSWMVQPATERVSTPIALTAGSRYDLKIEYYESGGGAVAKLSWSSPSQAKQIVPAGRLFPPPATSPGGSATPTISNIPDQVTTVNTATTAIPFTINDTDTPVNNLTLSKGSSNPTLVPANNIVFGGSGSSRTVTVTPAANQTGSATITVTVSDGSNSASDTFVLTVNAVATGTVTASFTNTAAITIPDQGAATPYPSVITVSGLGGTISNVTVTLRNLSQTWASDVDVLLVGPAGQKVVVMSDAGNGNANNVTLTLSDAAAAALPASGLVSGTFRPTNLSDTSPGGDNYPSPAPAGPYAATLSAFNGQTANGTWSLYVFDDGPGDQGSFAGGWSLRVTTAGAAARSSVLVEEPPRITSIIMGDQGAVRVTVSGPVGLSYALEASSNLLDWTKVEVLANVTGSIEFVDQPTTNAVRFYRAVSVPE